MRASPRSGSPPRASLDDRGGPYELGVGLSLAALILYLASRGRASSIPVLLVVVQAMILGIVLAVFLAYARALLGS